MADGAVLLIQDEEVLCPLGHFSARKRVSFITFHKRFDKYTAILYTFSPWQKITPPRPFLRQSYVIA